ncbi:hypothetical protein ACFFWC_29550 [Plantactinospora siamensis]|uniref:DUF5667 domain-containing protein n=1 Tax=Plantactinospora siamensis TaxID=555372 RepID=A0ABV6NZJ5_9ACTN
MRPGELLRRLDRRVLPALVRMVGDLGQGRSGPRVVTGSALLSVVAVLLTAVLVVGRPASAPPMAAGPPRIGVSQGESVPGYVETSRARLSGLLDPASATVETYALVTLAGYVAPDRLAPALGGSGVAAVFGRVPLPGVPTAPVRIPARRIPADVYAGMIEVARVRAAVAGDYRRQAAAVLGDGAAERSLRQRLRGQAEAAAAEAAAYRSGCGCLYAAVVRATPVALERVAARPEVRAVDPAPAVSRPEDAVFTPPLPEQRGLVTATDPMSIPPTDPVSGGASPPAGSGSAVPAPAASAPVVPVPAGSPPVVSPPVVSRSPEDAGSPSAAVPTPGGPSPTTAPSRTAAPGTGVPTSTAGTATASDPSTDGVASGGSTGTAPAASAPPSADGAG